MIALLFFHVLLSAPTHSPFASDVSDWLTGEVKNVALDKLLANISPKGVKPGVVLASPSQLHPDYYYHWIRDAALTMDTVNTLYKMNGDYEDLLWKYANLTQQLQSLPTLTGLGEPKFRVDGSVFNDGWCRPQTDGPALTSSTLMRFANVLKSKGKSFNSLVPIIQNYMDYVSSNWQQSTCDLWEEVRSNGHFYTRMVQRRALLEASDFFQALDSKRANKYKAAAQDLSNALDSHWNAERQHIVETPSDNSRQGLNAGTLLAVIHTDNEFGGSVSQFSPIDDRVLSTTPKFIESFNYLYNVNQQHQDNQGHPIGISVGRYSEDVYDGIGTSRGNPWFLCTAAVSEIYYRIISHFKKRGSIQINDLNRKFFESVGVSLANGNYQSFSKEFSQILEGIYEKADDTLRTVQYHSDQGRLAEEFNRDSGFSQGAKDLTWSYASLFTAKLARESSL